MPITFYKIATLPDGSLLATSAAPTTDAMIANKKYVDDNIVTPSALSDIDGDTKVQVEEGADDDTWRVDTAGVERARIHDDGIADFLSQSGFTASLSADQDIPSSVFTLMEFDTEEDDIQGEFNIGTYTWTATKDGKYQVSGVAGYTEDMADGKYVYTVIYKNGALYSLVLLTVGAISAGTCGISIRMPLVATDTIKLYTAHTHGANRELDKRYCRFSIAKIA